MPKQTDSVIFSDLEQEILELALQNPELTNAEIAEQTGSRLTLVRDVRAEYEDDVELADDVADAGDDSGTSTADTGDLSATQQSILDLAAEDPSLTNAEIAEETGARITLVRDTRAAHADEIDAADADAEDSDASSSGTDEPSDIQAEILELAESDPELTNAEIAEEVGARITLVRDTISAHGEDESASGSGTESSGSATAEIDTAAFSETQVEILETALANPELTNAEIAEQTGTRITLVRDTIRAHESDDEASDSSSSSESDDGEDVLEAVDTAAFSGTQLSILETALANPELTNAEIAAETGTRITLVRDTIHEHEYDEKPWVGNVEEETDDSDDDSGAEETTPDDEEIEMPETTDSELLSAAESAILEAALENPELTNAEIAEQTGSRLTLVRDTRALYEEDVELAADDDEETTSTSSSESAATPETTDSELLSATEQAILEAALEDSELTNREIADRTGARLTLVRDTRAAYEDDVELAGASAGDAESTDTGSADDGAAEPAADGGNGGQIVAVLLGVLLLIVLAAAAGVI